MDVRLQFESLPVSSPSYACNVLDNKDILKLERDLLLTEIFVCFCSKEIFMTREV